MAVMHIIILIYTHRSTRRVHQVNNEHTLQSIQANQRNNRLLKHILFLFVVFFVGWVPIYIIGVIYWNGTAISYVSYHAIQVIPAICFFINIIDLFWYNHELRKYFQLKICPHATQHA